MKERTTRISIKEALDHPWFVGANSDITKMRRQAEEEGNDTLKFISYSHTDANKANMSSPKNRMSPSNIKSLIDSKMSD